MLSERRRYNRIEQEMPCRYRIVGEEVFSAREKQNGLIINIGAAGLCFQASERITGDTVVNIEFKLGDMYRGPYKGCFSSKPVSLHGRVVWSGPAPSVEDMYMMGVEFLGTSGLKAVSTLLFKLRRKKCHEMLYLRSWRPERPSVSPPPPHRRS